MISLYFGTHIYQRNQRSSSYLFFTPIRCKKGGLSGCAWDFPDVSSQKCHILRSPQISGMSPCWISDHLIDFLFFLSPVEDIQNKGPSKIQGFLTEQAPAFLSWRIRMCAQISQKDPLRFNSYSHLICLASAQGSPHSQHIQYTAHWNARIITLNKNVHTKSLAFKE